jgi:hypothetical protein
MAPGFDRIEHQATDFELARDIYDLPAAPFAFGTQQFAHAGVATRSARSAAAGLSGRLVAIARQAPLPNARPSILGRKNQSLVCL